VSVLGLVPARGGSKGIPRKNARTFLGKPLVLWAVAAGRESGVLDRLVVSTDDDEIAALAAAAGAAVVRRPAELAWDDTPTAAVVAHALEADDELVVVLEPTSPGRRAEHVRNAVARLRDSGADSLATVSPVPHHYVPSKLLDVRADGTIAGVDGTPVSAMTHRRQDLETAYAFDGIVFACRAELCRRDPPTMWGERVLGLTVDPANAVDLDRPEDWAAAEAKLRDVLQAGAT
jgi:CMP-N-acetylneuraminic acid synthetase